MGLTQSLIIPLDERCPGCPAILNEEVEMQTGEGLIREWNAWKCPKRTVSPFSEDDEACRKGGLSPGVLLEVVLSNRT